MIQGLTRARQRQLAVTLLAVAIAVLLICAVGPVWSAHAYYRARIDSVVMELNALHADAAADNALRPRLERLRMTQMSNGHFLKSTTEAVAAAELQRIVNRIASDHAIQVLSTQILPAAREEIFTRVTLKVRIRGSLRGIVESVYEMESSPVFLFMDNVSIRSSTRNRSAAIAGTQQFDSEFELMAYMQGEST